MPDSPILCQRDGPLPAIRLFRVIKKRGQSPLFKKTTNKVTNRVTQLFVVRPPENSKRYQTDQPLASQCVYKANHTSENVYRKEWDSSSVAPKQDLENYS